MMNKNLTMTILSVGLAVILLGESSRGTTITPGAVLLHDYIQNSLADFAPGGHRPGTLGSAATLVPSGGFNNLAYVNLSGTNGNTGGTSHVKFDTTGTDTNNLFGLAENNGGDLTIEIWMDFDASNAVGTEDGASRFNLFHAYTPHGSDGYLYLDHRQTDPLDQTLGGSKDGDIINGTYRGGDAGRSSVLGLHQWVFSMDGNQPGSNGTWQIYRDGQLMVGASFGGSLSSDVYKTTAGNFFSLAGDPKSLTVGGEATGSGRFGDDPTGKLYRLQIYDKKLTPAEVQNNFDFGLEPIPEPTSLSLIALGGLALAIRRRRR